MTNRRSSAVRPARAAIVGAGLMGTWHARAIARAGARVVLVVDPDARRAAALAEHHRGALAVSAIEDATPGGFDTVHICSPIHTHEAMIRWAITVGAHVLAEKPLAATAAATRALLAEAASAGLALCPVHQMPFQRGARQALARKAALRPLHVSVTVCSAGAEGRDAPAHDGLVAEILPNPLALIAQWTEAPEDAAWHVGRSSPGELHAYLPSRPDVSLLISAHGRPPVNMARIIGEGGTAHVDLFHGLATFEGARVSKMRKAVRPVALGARLAGGASANLLRRAVLAQSAYPGLWELVREFYGCLLSGAPPPISHREILGVAEARDQILNAAGLA